MRRAPDARSRARTRVCGAQLRDAPAVRLMAAAGVAFCTSGAASTMKVVVIGKEPVIELQRWVASTFDIISFSGLSFRTDF